MINANVKFPNPPTWSSCFYNINVEALTKNSTVKDITNSDLMYLCKYGHSSYINKATVSYILFVNYVGYMS